MATEDQYMSSRRAQGGSARPLVTQLVALVVAGNTTVKGNVSVPVGSWIDSVQIETPVAISGPPTSSLVRVGVTDGGAEVVADVDGKAQGHIAATIVAALDKVGQAAAAVQTLFVQSVTTGAAGAAGTINVMVRYFPPVF